MAWIALEGMKFHGFHGVYAPEKVLGNDFVVDVFIQTETSLAAATDALELTVNYESVFQICRLEVEERQHQLIETIAAQIVAGLKQQFQTMMAIRVKVKKLNPPLGGRVESASIEEEFSFLKLCPRCKSPMICYDSESCWCRGVTLYQATRENLAQQFKGCLCKKCLEFFAN